MKDDLIFEVQKKYKELERNKSFYNNTIENLKNRIDLMKLIDIFTNQEYRNDISNIDFYWLVKNWNELVKSEDNIDIKIATIEVEFTEKEINNAELFFINNKTSNTNTIVIQDVIEVKEDVEFLVAKISAKDLTDIFRAVSWNPFAQRETTVRVVAGYGAIKTPTIYQKNVDSIKAKMKEGSFKANMISLNILRTDNETELFEYNKETRELTFTKGKGSVLDCIDGFHRLIAISELVQENPEFADNIHMQLKIWHLDIAEASDFVKQESSGTALSVEKKNTSGADLYLGIVRDLANSGTSSKNALKNRIGELAEVKEDLKFCNMDLFKISLEDNLSLENARQANQLKRTLMECWNEIIFANEPLFDDLKKSRTKSALTQNNIVAFFNYIIVSLFESNIEKDEIVELISKILKNTDFKINDKWDSLKITNMRYEKKARISIYNYAREVLGKELK